MSDQGERSDDTIPIRKGMTAKEEFDCYIGLFDRLWSCYNARRSFEWKFNLALWAAIAVFFGFAARGDISDKMRVDSALLILLHCGVFVLYTFLWPRRSCRGRWTASGSDRIARFGGFSEEGRRGDWACGEARDLDFFFGIGRVSTPASTARSGAARCLCQGKDEGCRRAGAGRRWSAQAERICATDDGEIGAAAMRSLDDDR